MSALRPCLLRRRCRKWIPLFYLTAIFVVYMVEFDDRYLDDDVEMHRGVSGVAVSLHWPNGFFQLFGWLCEVLQFFVYFWVFVVFGLGSARL